MLAFTAIYSWLYIYPSLWIGIDFERFFSASRMPISDIYAGPPFSFIYPPTAILFIRPLSLIDYWPGFAALTLVSIALFVTAVRADCGIKIAAASLLSFPAIEGLAWGQTPMLLGAALFGALSLKPKRRGLAIGILLTIKPQLFVAAPLFYLVRGDYRVLAAIIVGSASWIVVAILLFGLQPWLEWFSALPQFAAIFPQTVVLKALASPLGYAYASGQVAALRPVFLLSLALCIWLIHRTKNITDPAIVSAVIGGCSIICSPYSLPHDCILLIPAASCSLLHSKRADVAAAMTVFAGSCLPLAVPLFLILISRNRGANFGSHDRPSVATLQSGFRANESVEPPHYSQARPISTGDGDATR